MLGSTYYDGPLGQVSLISSFEVAYVVSRTHFRALQASGAREAGFFFTDQNHLPRRFQRAIARPQAKTGSAFLTGHTDTNLTFDPVILFPGLRANGACEAKFFFVRHFLMSRRFLWAGARRPAGAALQMVPTPELQLLYISRKVRFAHLSLEIQRSIVKLHLNNYFVCLSTFQ